MEKGKTNRQEFENVILNENLNIPFSLRHSNITLISESEFDEIRNSTEPSGTTTHVQPYGQSDLAVDDS